ncbi:hypothetical protein DE146DRAFT_656096 [Phaeosphaeria sp. MPI-PUGE-AT-0046c]|nr:hypothetical protein DE146DRAFT_656096 [Phaeosphaeria sp. MPI-PUGE-AT-0046c]
MSSSTVGGSAGQNGGRNTGASGGPHSSFHCRNAGQSGHPTGVWVSQYGGLCAHCQVCH